jgi:hypothetical protein
MTAAADGGNACYSSHFPVNAIDWYDGFLFAQGIYRAKISTSTP